MTDPALEDNGISVTPQVEETSFNASERGISIQCQQTVSKWTLKYISKNPHLVGLLWWCFLSC